MTSLLTFTVAKVLNIETPKLYTTELKTWTSMWGKHFFQKLILSESN